MAPTIATRRATLAQAKRHMDAMHVRKLAADRAYSVATDEWMEADDALNHSVQAGEQVEQVPA